MAQLAISALGAAIGSVTPLGPALGWTLGSIAGNILFGPDGAKKQQGPRLDDLTVQSSAQGQPIPRVYASMRVAGHLIWSTDIEEHEHEDEVGGKGVGGGAEVTTYTYSANLAVAFCDCTPDRPILLFRKIWADGKLIFDISSDAEVATVITSYKEADAIRQYYGSHTQEPDELIQSFEGVANTPAYRGTAYLVFENLQLADFGNRIPNITAEIIADGDPSFVGPTLVARPGHNQDFLEQSNDGTIDYWGQASSSGSGTTVTRRKYDLEGNFLTQSTRSYSVLDSVFAGSIGFSAVTMTGVVRGLPNVAAGAVTEMVPPSTQTWYAWFHNGFAVHQRLQKPDGSLISSSIENAQYYDSYIYCYPGDRDDGSNEVLRFPVADGYPLTQADESYIATESGLTWTAEDIYVDGSGVWYARRETELSPTRIRVDHLDHELNLIKTYTLAAEGGGTFSSFSILPCSSGTNIVYGQSEQPSSALWRVASLNSDGTTTVIGSGSATWTGGQVFRPFVLGNGVALNINGTYIYCGLYDDNGIPWSEVYADVFERCGLTSADYNVQDLEDDICRGFFVSRPQTGREIVAASQPHLFADIIESDWLLKVVQRGRDSSRSIVEDDLAAHIYGEQRPEELERRRRQDLELPREINVQYIDQARDYQSGAQYARRLTTDAVGVEFISMPIALTPDQARQNADGLLYDAWVGRDEYSVQVSMEYLAIDPADVVTIAHEGATHIVRVTDSTLQFPGVITLRGVSVRPPAFTTETLLPGALHDTYESDAPGTEAPVSADPVNVIPGPTSFVLLDIPILRDVDDNAGMYYAVRGYTDSWRGARIYRSTDGAAYSEVDSHLTSAQVGVATTTLASGSTTVVDNGSSVTVLINGTLTSTTDAGLLNFTNMAAIGSHGRWEILSFKTATLNAGGTYTLSGFLRGLRGTDHNVGNHTSSDTVVILSSTTIDRFISEVSELGQDRFYKGVSIGATLQETTAQEIEVELQALKPLSPVHVKGIRNTSTNDWTLTAVRRGRVQPLWMDYVDVPLGEDSQSYSIDILNGSAVVRTLTSSTPTVTYTSAQQVSDFGSVRTTFSGNWYQVSAAVGRGTARSFTV